MLTDYDTLSDEAKRAWQRGFDLAYPRSPRAAFKDWVKEHGGGEGWFVCPDPVSRHALLAEVEKQESEDCRIAMTLGFVRGLIAKTEAAQGEASDDRGPAC